MQSINQIFEGYKPHIGQKESFNPNGLSSGFEELDKHTLGFQNGQLTILAGRQQIGKTTLALNFARNVANQTDDCIVIFTVDQTSEGLTNNLLKSEHEATKVNFDDKNVKIKGLPIYIDDTQCISIFEIMERLATLKHNKDISFVIVDYLQLIGGFVQNTKKEKTNSYENISQLLRIVAKTLNVPVLLLSMLPRIVEKRSGDKKPILNDLYSYGAIEKFADTVLFLYQWEYYGIDTDHFGENTKNQSLVIISKSRNGQRGEIKLRHDFDIAKFMNIESV